MTAIVIFGSPRRGNTEWMLGFLMKQLAKKDIKCEPLYLRKLTIKRCTGCLSCEEGGVDRKGVCKITDDMESIYPKLLAADGWIIGSPVYFEMVSGLLKNFMDRTCPIWTKLKGKKVCGIAVAEEGIGKTIDNIKTYCGVCGMQFIGSVTALAKTSKEVSHDKSVAKKLVRLASRFTRALAE
jgi:multimeric flavodoxin WrbA